MLDEPEQQRRPRIRRFALNLNEARGRGPDVAAGAGRARERGEHSGDLGDIIDLAGRDGDDELVGPIVVRIEDDVVLGEEDVGGEPGEALVAVNQRVIARERMQQGSGLS